MADVDRTYIVVEWGTSIRDIYGPYNEAEARARADELLAADALLWGFPLKAYHVYELRPDGTLGSEPRRRRLYAVDDTSTSRREGHGPYMP